MAGANGQFHFDVHPSVVFQLGRDLITDHVQAVVELIKNAYDANATYATVEISTTAKATDALEESLFREALGFVKIEDDGDGMSEDTVRNSWLVLSNSPKREQKTTGTIPRGARPPLGDKGLGRLSSQRLGTNLEIVTRRKQETKAAHVGICWSDFATAASLGEVKIHTPDTPTKRKAHGTTVFISGIVEPQVWTAKDVKASLETRLGHLISPYDPPKNFSLVVTLNGVKLDLAAISSRVREEADLVFKFSYAEEVLHIDARFRLRALRPGTFKDRFEERCEQDGGDALFAYLTQELGEDPKLTRLRSAGWYVQIKRKVNLRDVPDSDLLLPVGAKEVPAPEGESTPAPAQEQQVEPAAPPPLADPGPFVGEFGSFNLSAERKEDFHSSHFSWDDYRRHLKEFAGVRVFRDGFGVKVDGDFLGLGQQQTRGSSWYGLRPGNTMGFIAISVKGNPELIETTDREGFKDSPHFRNFMRLLQDVVGFAAVSIENLRRETIEFLKVPSSATEPGAAGPVRAPSAEEIATQFGEELGKTPEILRTVSQTRSAVHDASERISKLGPTLPKAAQGQIRELVKTVGDAVKILTNAESVLQRVSTLHDRYQTLQVQIEQFEDRLSRTYEAVSLGLTVEAFAHEISHVIQRLAEQSSTLSRHLGRLEAPDQKTLAFLRHVQSAVGAIRKQLAHLEPSLRYARETRTVIDLREFLREQEDHHQARLRDHKIKLELDLEDGFSVRVSRGKLTQVLDNLILNSQYWLGEAIRVGSLKQGRILIRGAKPRLRLEDNGRGIDPSVENTIFSPFVTTRPGGRGLGLFVARELLRSEGCDLTLASERNTSGRRFAFDFDLSGIIHDG